MPTATSGLPTGEVGLGEGRDCQGRLRALLCGLGPECRVGQVRGGTWHSAFPTRGGSAPGPRTTLWVSGWYLWDRFEHRLPGLQLVLASSLSLSLLPHQLSPEAQGFLAFVSEMQGKGFPPFRAAVPSLSEHCGAAPHAHWHMRGVRKWQLPSRVESPLWALPFPPALCLAAPPARPCESGGGGRLSSPAAPLSSRPCPRTLG